MPTKAPQPLPKNKFIAAAAFDRGVAFALLRLGVVEDQDTIWMDGYIWAKGLKESILMAKNVSLEGHGYQPIGLIMAQEQQPTSPPPPRKQ